MPESANSDLSLVLMGGLLKHRLEIMTCREATESYEAWLAKHTPVIKDDLEFKHQQMTAAPFLFLRATFYRWVELLAASCDDLAKAPIVLAVGDLHVENFGTWRDQEGRLVWGINDFDEAFQLPYTNDLVRLAASAYMAISAAHIAIQPADACEAILNGYTEGLKGGGRPFVLAEEHEWLRTIAINKLRDPCRFWEHLNGLPTAKNVPATAKHAVAGALPGSKLPHRIVHRRAGLGSLGRQRFVALADWDGGNIAREAKPVVPSACAWASRDKAAHPQYARILQSAIRCPDPFLKLYKGWVVRRLAPDCSRVELEMLPKGRDAYRLLKAAGRETANVHLGSGRIIAKVKRDLSHRPPGWLRDAARTMARVTIEDWRAWSHSIRS